MISTYFYSMKKILQASNRLTLIKRKRVDMEEMCKLLEFLDFGALMQELVLDRFLNLSRDRLYLLQEPYPR